MRKKIFLIGIIAFAALGLSVYLQADFVQCPGGVCDGGNGITGEADLINGTDGVDDIDGLGGMDVVFAGRGMDFVMGGPGNDLLFGGPDSDSITGAPGNDVIFNGSDEALFNQFAFGGDDNDQFNTFASETTECLWIDGEAGNDVANLIGYGPFTAVQPFGQPGFGTGYIWTIDPIGGGDVLIYVEETGNLGTEVVNGLTSPNVTILLPDDPIVLGCLQVVYATVSPSGD
jgi:hypothetical protein